MLLFDRAGWHTTPNLVMPKNITPIWLPSRAPELNPVENIWAVFAGELVFQPRSKPSDDIIDAICDAWNKLIAQPGNDHINRDARMGPRRS